MKRYCHVVSLVFLSVGLQSHAGWREAWLSEDFSPAGTVLALGAPTLRGPADGRVFVPGDKIVLTWSAVPDAKGYIYEVNGNQETAPLNYAELPPVLPDAVGDYSWRVRARNDYEVGPWSEDTWTFHIRLATPTPTPTQFGTPLPDLDVDGNGRVDHQDTFSFLSEWHQANARYDYTGEGMLDQADVLLYLKGWKSPGRLFPTPVPLLPAPQLSVPLDGEVIDFWDIHRFDPREHRENGVDFAWSPVQGAEWYELRIQGPEGWSNLGDYVESELGRTEFTVTLPVRPDNLRDRGLYHWQVRGFSATQGGYGAYSDPFTFEIEYSGPLPTPTPTPIPRSADLDENSQVTIEDIFTFALAWGVSEASQPQQYGAFETADLDRSGQINAGDLHLFLGSYHRRVEEAIHAPVLLSPTDGSGFLLLEVGASDFQWTFQASPGAAVYEYELSQPSPLPPLKRGFMNDTGAAVYNLRSVVTPARAGQWQWRVRAHGPTGRVSLWSPRWTFTVY